jgi:hypothetical protein
MASGLVAAASHAASLSFEQTVLMSDRIVVGTMQGAGGSSVRLPDGRDINLGIKEPGTGLVFTPYRIRITACLFDKDGSCRLGESEAFIPGGTVYETVGGAPHLRTWEVGGAAGAALPPVGDDVLLFLTERNGRYLPHNDPGARIRVDHSMGSASVTLRFSSPRFLSEAGLESVRLSPFTANPAAIRPVFFEAVDLRRLNSLIDLARQAPMPTSGLRHAVPDGVRALDPHALGVRSHGVRTREDPHRRESSLDLRNDTD